MEQHSNNDNDKDPVNLENTAVNLNQDINAKINDTQSPSSDQDSY